MGRQVVTEIRSTNTQKYVAWPCPFFGATQVEHQWINRPMASEVRGRIWPPYIGTLPATFLAPIVLDMRRVGGG